MGRLFVGPVVYGGNSDWQNGDLWVPSARGDAGYRDATQREIRARPHPANGADGNHPPPLLTDEPGAMHKSAPSKEE